MALSKEDLIRDLRETGVNAGDHIGVGIAYKSLGVVDGGPKTFVEALLGAVGKEGTILLPSFTVPSHVPMSYVFDPRQTPAYTGLISELVRKNQHAYRSLHPTNSVVALGRLAEHFTAEHNERSSEYAPYGRLADSRGKVISIGIGDRLVAIRHEAQRIAGLLVPASQKMRFVSPAGEIRHFTRTVRPGCTEQLPRLVAMMRREGVITDGKVGNAGSVLARAGDVLDYMSRYLKERPQLNLCESLTCLWCRELERRLDLFDRIDHPKLFQRSLLIRTGVAAINAVRMRDYRPVIWMEAAVKRIVR